MFDINDRNKMFAYVPSKSDLTVDNINLYSNSLIFIGDENQIYQPLTNTYIGIGNTAYNNLFNDYISKIDKLYIHSTLNDDNKYYFPILKTAGINSFYYTYLSSRIGVNPDKQLFIGNLSGTSYTSSYSYIYPNSNDENLPLIFADITDNINNTIYKDSENSIFYNPFKNSFGHGNNVVASGNYSTAEGINNIADGISSHVEGSDNMAYGYYSHVGGSQSVSYGESTFVHGTGLISESYSNVVVFGKWNDTSYNDNVFIIGNGIDNENRSNLFEIRDNGCAYATTFVGNLNGRARWADHATYSTYTTYTTYALYNSYQSIHDISLDKKYYITFGENSTYSLSYIDTDFYYNPSTNVLNSYNFVGNLTGDVTGNLTGNVTGDVTGNLTGDVTGNVTGDVVGNLTGDVTGNVNGNSYTATKLKTPVLINGELFDGTKNVTLTPEVLLEGNFVAVQIGNQTSNYVTIAYAITSDLANRATKLNTKRKINGVDFDGTTNITIAPSLIIKGNTVASKVGNQTSTYITVPYATSSGNTTGNAATADKWKTARTLTIGATGKSVDGSANVSWSLDDIGVYSKEDSEDRYVNVTGDTMTGDLNTESNIILTKGGTNQNRTFSFKRTNNNCNIDVGWDWTNTDGSGAFFRSVDDTTPTGSGGGAFGFFARNSSATKQLIGQATGSLTWDGNNILHAGNYTSYTVTKTGGGASGTWGISISGNAATATTWQTSRTLTIGSTGKSVNGSANVSWSLDEIGVYSKTAADSRYVNVTGDTMTGHLKMSGTKDLGTSWDKGVIAGADGHDKVVLSYLASSTNGAVIGAHNSALSDWSLLNVSGTQLVFRIGQNEKMRLNASGYLGIGTSSPSYLLHVNGNAFASGFIKSGSSASYVLTGDGGHKQWSESASNSTIVARTSSGYVYAKWFNTTSGDMNDTSFSRIYVSNDSFIRYVSKAKFIEAITAYDTVTITKSLTVTEAWMDTGIVANTSTFTGGSGTYAIKISHANLNTPASNGYASIYSGIISIYTDATNSTTDAEEVILHRAGYSWANRIYIRTMPVASSGNCKIQIATSKTWTTASNITFTFRKLI